MPAGTDARGRSEACPVCDEPLSGRPERCFRCETTLTGWWSFEDALAGIPASPGVAAAGAAPPSAMPTAVSLAAAEPGATAAVPRPHHWWASAGFLAGAALVALVFLFRTRTAVAPGEATVTPAVEERVAPASVATIPSPPAPPAIAVETPPPSATASSAVVRYRVQRGDSLWRVAAAVTGDGRRWKELWPDREPGRPLRAGEVLVIDPGRLERR